MIVDLAGVDLSQSDADGWVVESLSEWWDLPDSKSAVTQRPNADGDFAVSRVFRDSMRPTATIRWKGKSEAEASSALRALRGLVSRGVVELAVDDGAGALSRQVEVRRVSVSRGFEWWNLPVAVDMLARDPLLYGPEQVVGPIGRPDPGPGAAYPWVYPVVYGEPGSTGRITLTNSGTADVAPWSIKVTGPLPNFSIVEVETGRRLVFSRLVGDGDVITLDPRSGRASINGQSDVTASLFIAEWPVVPAGQSRTYQFLAPSGTGQLSMSVRPAFL